MTVRRICINAMGIAMFVALALCLQVPVFENYYLCLGYVAMAFYAYFFGAAGGTLVGVLGVLIYCILTGGLRGMPGWVLGNAVIGVMCGIAAGYAKKRKGAAAKHGIMIAAVIVSTAIGILGVKSLVEVLLYSLPFIVRTANNIYAFAADAVVLVVGFEICINGEETWNKLIGGRI